MVRVALGWMLAGCGSDPGQGTIREPGGSVRIAVGAPEGGRAVSNDATPLSDGREVDQLVADGDASVSDAGTLDASTSARDARTSKPVETRHLDDATRARLPKDLSFLVITIDTLRPDLGCMGYDRPVSPHIDRLAERSVVYEKAYSISTYTGFSLTPMMASRYVSEMPRTDRHEVKYLKQNMLLAERLLAAGYHTAGAASHFLFAPELGWIDGFERFRHLPGEGKAPPGSPIDSLHSSRGLADATIQMLSDARVTTGPFFIWVHFLDPHKQYLEHPGFSNFGSDKRALYDGEVAYTDFHIGRVLDALAASPLRDRTAVILTADHGEAFGEHGFSFHGRHVWDEVVRIPLMAYVPGITPRRVTRRISSVEVAPTILELAGLPEDKGARGQSFAAELFGADQPERPILIDQPQNPYYPLTRAFIDHDIKLHFLGGGERRAGQAGETDSYRLFDLSRDPGEQNDLATSDPELLQRMRQAYQTFMAGVPEVAPRPIAPATPKSGGQ